MGRRLPRRSDSSCLASYCNKADLRDDFDVDFPLVFHGDGLDYRAERIGDATLLADHFAQIAGSDAYLIGGRLFLRHFGNVHLIRLVYERFYQVLNELLQWFSLQADSR